MRLLRNFLLSMIWVAVSHCEGLHAQTTGLVALEPLEEQYGSKLRTISILDVTDFFAVYIDPVIAAEYFPKHSRRTRYQALVAFPVGGNDYVQTEAKDAEIEGRLFYRRPFKLNESSARPQVGNFHIHDGRLRVTFENMGKEKTLFQLPIKKYPSEREIPRTYQALDLDDEKTFLNALVLTPDGRFLMVKGTGREFFTITNRISERGYVFRMDAGMNEQSYSSDPEISGQPGWDGVHGLFEDAFNNVGGTAGVVFYDREEGLAK